jgi:hypothetical protein
MDISQILDETSKGWNKYHLKHSQSQAISQVPSNFFQKYSWIEMNSIHSNIADQKKEYFCRG